MLRNINSYRRKKNRCGHRLVEIRDDRKDSWLCSLVIDHESDHESHSGHRTWPNKGSDDDFVRDYRALPVHPLTAALHAYVLEEMQGCLSDGEAEAIAEEMKKFIDSCIQEALEAKEA